MAKKYDKADRPEMSPDEMFEVAKGVFDRTLADDKLAEKLKNSKLILCFKYHDEERWGSDVIPELTVDCIKDPVEITLGPCDIKPTITMTMEAFTAHLFWMQKLNLMSAITRGQIKAKGPIPKAMRLLPLLKPFYANYREQLKSMGRDDLLNFPPD
ncbi:MAG: SCP2 sterol-binding domain-containing protein [Actinobacteria bacterium]|nr:SCP2 sterol-binding domain-containing protein [Actinomycetota bacterium]MBU4386700.1 SCP2 sterol-binding domain-containing protein [Actinomycetota bacterium]